MAARDRDDVRFTRTLSLSLDEFNLVLVVTHKYLRAVREQVARFESLLNVREEPIARANYIEAIRQQERTMQLIQTLWESRLYDPDQNTYQAGDTGSPK